MSKHPLRGYLDRLKPSVSDTHAPGHSTTNCYSYAEVPDWAIRQAITDHDALLKALQALLGCVDHDQLDSDPPKARTKLHDARDDARAAIAKAEGES